ncbi:MAG: acyl-CoA reductase [Leadbetterella sp.]
MTLEERKLLFVRLGKKLQDLDFQGELSEVFSLAKSRNPWFTLDNLQLAIKGIYVQFLAEDKLDYVIQMYTLTEPASRKTIGIVAAGNIPLVAFQDIVHTFLLGHTVALKPSSQDEILYRFVFDLCYTLSPESRSYFTIVDKINASDAYIATGSNNTARYFEYYFASKPHIIRKNRSSIAVLSGKETAQQFRDLASDIFTYFGLGCRNVSRFFVPKGYDFREFFEAIEFWSTVSLHSKYNNNYDYMKSIYLVNGEPFLDNGFLMVRESQDIASPISVIYYSYYEDLAEVNAFIHETAEKIQTVVSSDSFISSAIPFGQSQLPYLLDYPDGVDTVKFLQNLGKA